MALQIRRGTDAQRQGITPKAGEPIFTTDTKKLFIGDGSTAGGIIVDTTGDQLTDIIQDTTPQLGGTLDLNNNNITGTGNINITGQISASNIDLKGSIFADDSTLLIDGISGKIVGPVESNVVGNVTGDVTGNVTGNLTGNANGNHTGTFDGTVTAVGQFEGQVLGSIFGDDSTMLIDGVNNAIVGPIRTTSNINVDANALAAGVNAIRTTGYMQPTGLNSGLGIQTLAARNSGSNTPITLQPGDFIKDIIAAGYDGTDYTTCAVIKMGADKYKTIQTGKMAGRMIFTAYKDDGTFGLDTIMVFQSDGKLSIGAGDNPQAKLDVAGDGKFTGTVNAPAFQGDVTADDSTVMFNSNTGQITAPGTVTLASYTTTQRDALTPANGMIIYNTTTSKLEAHAGGTWVSLH